MTSAKLDKSWGRGLDEADILSGLERFLSGAGSSERKEIIRLKILSRLCKIRDWFLTQSSFRFYASSILILYEGLCPNDIGSQVKINSKVIGVPKRYKIADLGTQFALKSNLFDHRKSLMMSLLGNLISF